MEAVINCASNSSVRLLVSIGVVREQQRSSTSGGVARLLSALTLELPGQQHPHPHGPTPAVTTAPKSAAYQPVESLTAVSEWLIRDRDWLVWSEESQLF